MALRDRAAGTPAHLGSVQKVALKAVDPSAQGSLL